MFDQFALNNYYDCTLHEVFAYINIIILLKFMWELYDRLFYQVYSLYYK